MSSIDLQSTFGRKNSKIVLTNLEWIFHEIRWIWSGFPLIEDFFILDLKNYQRFIKRCVSVPNFIGIMLWTFPVLHPFFRMFLEKNFIECVSSPYVDNFTLLDSNLTNTMMTNFLSDATIKVIWFEIFSKWKSFFEQSQKDLHTISQNNSGPSQVLIWSRHKQILRFFIFSLKKKC